MKLLDETLYWLVVIQIFVTVHFWHFERNNHQPKHFHLGSWIASFIMAFFFSYVLFDTWYFRIVNMIFLGFVYWIMFPLEMNIYAKKDLLYLGDPRNNHGSWLDQLERRMKNPGATLALKIVIVIACAFILLNLPNPWG